MNRTLSNLKLETAQQIRENESEKEKKKEGKSWGTITMVATVMIIVGIIGYMMLMQYTDVSEIQQELGDKIRSVGTLQGELAACELALQNERGVTPGDVIPI